MDTTLRPGDQLTARVTRRAPFGVLVETESGIPGLVLNASAEPGDNLTIRVESYDSDKVRFSAALV